MIHYYSIWPDIHDTVPAANPMGFFGVGSPTFLGREGNENYNIESKVHRGSRMSLSSCSA